MSFTSRTPQGSGALDPPNSALAAQQIGLHLLVALQLDRATPLEIKLVRKPHEAGLRYLDLIRNAARFHGAGSVNGIAPDIVGEFVHADAAGHDVSGMEADPDP